MMDIIEREHTSQSNSPRSLSVVGGLGGCGQFRRGRDRSLVAQVVTQFLPGNGRHGGLVVVHPRVLCLYVGVINHGVSTQGKLQHLRKSCLWWDLNPRHSAF